MVTGAKYRVSSNCQSLYAVRIIIFFPLMQYMLLTFAFMYTVCFIWPILIICMIVFHMILATVATALLNRCTFNHRELNCSRIYPHVFCSFVLSSRCIASTRLQQNIIIAIIISHSAYYSFSGFCREKMNKRRLQILNIWAPDATVTAAKRGRRDEQKMDNIHLLFFIFFRSLILLSTFRCDLYGGWCDFVLSIYLSGDLSGCIHTCTHAQAQTYTVTHT